MARPMARVVEAACACTRPGDSVRIAADIELAKGTVVMRAPEAPELERCLQGRPSSFEPFLPPDDQATDCIQCGPRHYGVFRGSKRADPPAAAIRVVLPLHVDRTGEVLACGPGSHPEQGACRPDRPPVAPAAPKHCGCGAGDLRCSIDCAAASL